MRGCGGGGEVGSGGWRARLGLAAREQVRTVPGGDWVSPLRPRRLASPVILEAPSYSPGRYDSIYPLPDFVLCEI